MLLAVTVAGLALRLAAARGGLWLDEAWSAMFARDVGTPAGVFLNINHDNNHHLTTLWLQIVGIDAPPMVQRALSIASGTAAIILAGLIGARRGATTGIAAAVAFAVSPILVTYGSEARGYAPMVACLLGTIWLIDRWLDDRGRPAPAIGIAVLIAAGILSQLTMVFALPALAGWIGLRPRRVGDRVAVRDVAQDMARALGPGMVVAAILTWAILRGWPGPAGLHFGSYQPFRYGDWTVGVSDMTAFTFGIPTWWAIALAILALAAAGAWRIGEGRRGLYLLAIVAFPLAVAALRLGNAAIARYYLLSAVALLLVAADLFGVAMRRGRAVRFGALAVAIALSALALVEDARFIGAARGDPARAVAMIRARAPSGSAVAIDRPRAEPVLAVAAARAGYPLDVARCAPFLFVDRDGDEPFPARPLLCGRRYVPITGARTHGLSGTHWTLYERAP